MNGVADVDPIGVEESGEFVVRLRRRRMVAGLSYRELARRARQAGDWLPPSTVATMLHRSTLPGRELVAAYIRACGGGDAEVAAWLAARARVAATAVGGPDPAPDRVVTGGVPLDRVVPRQLPPDPAALVGRVAQVAEMDAAADGPGSALLVVTGPPGVGTSALAVHWAHRQRARFPDGEVYVDLGDDGRGAPLSVGGALSALLTALGVPADQIPEGERPAAALFRSLVADRRLLVLMDGAVSAEQVRPLRPGGSGVCTVVTSHDRLAGLVARDGGRTVDVPCLARRDAVRVLAGAAGADLVAPEPAAAARLARLCGGLPLALRIAATALDPYARAPVADLVAAMRAFGRLDTLAVTGDPATTLETVLGRAYRQLDATARRMFRVLGRLPATHVTAEVAAAATRGPVTDARAALRRLADRHLVIRRAGDRYTMVGLLREYARRLAALEDAPPPTGAARSFEHLSVVGGSG
ncbi:helix-turn-helix domain-containing protein [Actinomycetes bacterium KLBMP 9797]